jgi:hypothetical protein
MIRDIIRICAAAGAFTSAKRSLVACEALLRVEGSKEAALRVLGAQHRVEQARTTALRELLQTAPAYSGALAPGTPMHRALVDCGIELLTAASITVSSAPSLAKVTITPAERCSRLSRPVDEAIGTKAADKQVAAASALQKKDVRLCAEDERAQGIRALAKL